MKKILWIVGLMLVCSGCAESLIDPQGYTARTQAQERTRQAQFEAQQAMSQADIERAQAAGEQADADARQAEANARAREAEAAARQVETQADVEMEKAQLDAWQGALQTVEDATKRNMGVIYLLILAVVGLSGTAIYWFGRTNAVMASSMNAHMSHRPMLSANMPHPNMLSVEQQVALIAQREGLIAQFDGQRWLLVDEAGNVVRQQKLLAG